MDQKVYNRAYYLAHRSELLPKCLKYQATHRKQHYAVARRWIKEHPELLAIANAKQRCTNPNRPGYENYGGRGILCKITYKELLNDIGSRPSKFHSLDRIDNDGHYEKGNLRWATRKQQNANRRDR
jgi:hypothetical protein